ncbi:RNA-binding S4 domain-containing protein [Parabacteroides faecis]|uniref:pseudouridine synthase n=1 Tax=Parabacteroides faecis TaxID=1217282 RepID=UPI002164ECCF|nr:pseudouridine synthase [Parabacteroides faecis]MCS2891544.1 RNA-binding S4 domain-containing protein [Parabacteroides faecis]UVQ44819.1 RNA-binding S4 domain-containing protein [Parabacteroides faecis]
MSTEEREESQPRPRKVIPSIRRENTDQEGERRPYNQGYSRPEGNNYERRPYNRPIRDDRGGYNSYGDNRSSYGDRPSRPRTYENREGGYNSRPSYNNRDNNRGGYGSSNREGGYNSRPSYGNNRPSYGNDRPYGGGDRPFNRPSRPNYDERPGRAYSASPEGEAGGDGMKKRRPRVGDTRVNSYDSRDNRGGGRPSYGNNNRGGGYGNNGGYGNRRPGGQQRRTNDYNPNAKYNFQKQLKYKEVLADPNEPIRLNKFLSNAGVCSRREADEFITAGAVKVNDVAVTELGTKITRQDKVEFNGKPVQIESKVYIVLNKPKNCVTTSDDPQERLTVMDLVKNACQERIYPVGRLDRNTTGVLLLTNDGDLASKLTHPSFKKKKIYHVWLDKNVSIEDMEKIANGLELEDGEIHADAISYASEDDKSQVGIEIHSGRNRIVRRIFESLGYHVTKLDRVYFAGLTKKMLGRGKWRYLNEREVNALRMGAFE